MTQTFIDILCKENKLFKEIERDFGQVIRDIKALTLLRNSLRQKKQDIIKDYAKTSMRGKCYKKTQEKEVSYIQILEYLEKDSVPYLSYKIKRVKQDGTIVISNKEIKVDLLNFFFSHVEEITKVEFDNIG